MKWEVTFEGKGDSSLNFPAYTGPSEHYRIASGLRQWAWVCFQPCEEARAGAVLASQKCVWQQNLVHYIGLSVGKEVQPIAAPEEQEEWDKQTKNHLSLDRLPCNWFVLPDKIHGNNWKTTPIFLVTGFLTATAPFQLFTKN